MASTRASSPTGDASTPTSPQLTPRSKLKAMLAAVDDGSSEDESAGPIDAKSLFAAIDKNKQKLSHDQSPQDESTDDDDDAQIIRPRGRIAARMHADFTEAVQPSTSPSSTTKRLQRDGTSRSTSEKSIAQESSLIEDQDDDEDVVTSSRRRPTRPLREVTPESSAQADRHSSPSLFVSPSPQKSFHRLHQSIKSNLDLPSFSLWFSLRFG